MASLTPLTGLPVANGNLRQSYFYSFIPHDRCGAAASPTSRNVKFSRGRCLVIQASKCPFGFQRPVGNGNREPLLDSTNVAMTSPPITSPYAPAPSAEAPDDVNLGPGTFEYLPLKVPYKMMMGLEPLNMKNWIEIDVFYDEEMALRREILETRKSVAIASQAEATEANWEVLEMLAEFLPMQFPDRFAQSGNTLHNLSSGESFNILDRKLDPLEVVARLIQEDICLLMPVDGVLRLVSGAVLFPQRWHLLEKMGMDMIGIHMPVPLYEDEIGPSVNHFMTRLKVGKPVWRANWTIVDDPTLFQPLNEEDIYAAIQGKVRNPNGFSIDIGNAGSRLYTRCERETLIRLPRTGAILFTIRTYIKPLSVFESRPTLAAKMVRAMEALPESIYKYKTMAGFYNVALEYLEKCAGL